VFPKNQIARVGIRSWLKAGREQDLNMVETETYQEALDYLKLHTNTRKIARNYQPILS
jgi:hypothetical protein